MESGQVKVSDLYLDTEHVAMILTKIGIDVIKESGSLDNRAAAFAEESELVEQLIKGIDRERIIDSVQFATGIDYGNDVARVWYKVLSDFVYSIRILETDEIYDIYIRNIRALQTMVDKLYGAGVPTKFDENGLAIEFK